AFGSFGVIAFLAFAFVGADAEVVAAASVGSTGAGVASAFVAFLDLSLWVVCFVAVMHLPRGRFVLAGLRTNCVAISGSVTYLAGGETSRQLTAEIGRSPVRKLRAATGQSSTVSGSKIRIGGCLTKE